jgi:hypothetical protein
MKYSSSAGLKTKVWGPAAWDFLFSSIMGSYPYKINKNNKEHLEIKKYFKLTLKGLQHTLPCVFCRESYKKFWKQLPIENYLKGRVELMYWLYLIKDKVNNKLIEQEQEEYNQTVSLYKQMYYSGKLSRNEYFVHLETWKTKCFQTIPSPPFQEVLEFYESRRAGCSKRTNSCN